MGLVHPDEILGFFKMYPLKRGMKMPRGKYKRVKKEIPAKAAKGKRGRKANSDLRPSTSGDIPEGFVMPASAQVPNWDFEKKKILQGEIIAVKVITKKKVRKGEKKTTRLMIVKEDSGNLLQLWESAALTGLFDETKKGKTIWVRFDGHGEKVKGRMPMKLFTTAYQ